MNTLKEYGLNECFLNEASLYPNLKLARVIAQFKGLYKPQKIVSALQRCRGNSVMIQC